MALQHTRLTEVVQLGSSAASIYSNPAATKSHVRGFLLHNTNTTSETATLYWVPDSGGSVGTATAAMKLFKVVLAADESLILEIPYGLVMLDANESIQAFSTTASKVNCAVLGDKDS